MYVVVVVGSTSITTNYFVCTAQSLLIRTQRRGGRKGVELEFATHVLEGVRQAKGK